MPYSCDSEYASSTVPEARVVFSEPSVWVENVCTVLPGTISPSIGVVYAYTFMVFNGSVLPNERLYFVTSVVRFATNDITESFAASSVYIGSNSTPADNNDVKFCCNVIAGVIVLPLCEMFMLNTPTSVELPAKTRKLKLNSIGVSVYENSRVSRLNARILYSPLLSPGKVISAAWTVDAPFLTPTTHILVLYCVVIGFDVIVSCSPWITKTSW